MIPDWAHAITLADLVIAAVFIAAIVTAGWKAFATLRGFLDRIEAKTDRAVHNTQPNGGDSPHDQLMAQSRATTRRLDCLSVQVRDLTEHLGANHPGSVDPETGRPVMPPPNDPKAP